MARKSFLVNFKWNNFGSKMARLLSQWKISDRIIRPIIPDPCENRKWFNEDPYCLSIVILTLFSANYVTGNIFWRQFCQSSFWLIILSHRPRVPFFWGWYSQILTLTERGKGRHKKGGDNLIYKPPLLSFCTSPKVQKSEKKNSPKI